MKKPVRKKAAPPKSFRAIPDLGNAVKKGDGTKATAVRTVLQGAAYYMRKARVARHIAGGGH